MPQRRELQFAGGVKSRPFSVGSRPLKSSTASLSDSNRVPLMAASMTLMD